MKPLWLPWPPTANTNVRHTKAGGHYRTAPYKEFCLNVLARVVEAGLHRWPFTGRLRVTIEAFPPDLRNRDLDNVVKPCMDACQRAGLFPNDFLVDELHVCRRKVYPPKGYLLLTVERIV